MNKTDKANVANTAKAIMEMYMHLKDRFKNDPHALAITSQGYRDSLEAMKRNHLIIDYLLDSGTVITKDLS
jgi:hypothetical protein